MGWLTLGHCLHLLKHSTIKEQIQIYIFIVTRTYLKVLLNMYMYNSQQWIVLATSKIITEIPNGSMLLSGKYCTGMEPRQYAPDGASSVLAQTKDPEELWSAIAETVHLPAKTGFPVCRPKETMEKHRNLINHSSINLVFWLWIHYDGTLKHLSR